jgi:hypothetical protein
VEEAGGGGKGAGGRAYWRELGKWGRGWCRGRWEGLRERTIGKRGRGLVGTFWGIGLELG